MTVDGLSDGLVYPMCTHEFLRAMATLAPDSPRAEQFPLRCPSRSRWPWAGVPEGGLRDASSLCACQPPGTSRPATTLAAGRPGSRHVADTAISPSCATQPRPTRAALRRRTSATQRGLLDQR